jgi:ArsR family transcriptional regulator
MELLAKSFKALSDESRLRILGIILSSEELCVCDIGYVTGFTQTKVSRHLSYLKNAGLVEDRRQGLWMLYRIAVPEDAARRELIECVRTVLAADPAAQEDARRLEESINGGCCTSYACLRPKSGTAKHGARKAATTKDAPARVRAGRERVRA